MAVSDAFLNPLGLLGLLSVVPLIILYIIKPDPRRLAIPTLEFLPNVSDEGGTDPVIERLRRNILLLIQLLALILIALALAQPAIEVSKSAASGETVIVLDASGSMGVDTGAGTRFSQAVDRATSEVTSTTSVVIAGSSTRIAVNQGSASEARTALDTVTHADVNSDLRSAISQGLSLASEDARIVVVSDFADDSNWRSIVDTARARGNPVQLEQVDGGGEANVGITDLSFAGTTVTASVKNYGDEEVTRTVSLGAESEELTLAADDVQTARFPVPAGGGEISLSPGDSLPTDDVAAIAAPDESGVDVVLVTNDRNRFLHAALSEMSAVNVEVKNPPVGDLGEPDAVIFSNVAGDELLQTTLNGAERVLGNGGGVAIQAQNDLGEFQDDFGGMLPVEVTGVGAASAADAVSESRLVQDVDFSPPEQYLEGRLEKGRALVNASDDSPLVAIASEGSGRVLYHGFMEDSSDFNKNYLYPIYWKRMVFHLAGRERLSSMNVQTGSTFSFPEDATVDTPRGTSELSTITLDDAGYYSAGNDRVGANMLSAAESDVAVDSINTTATSGPTGGDSSTTVPRRLTPLLALLALGLVATEVGLLKYRGEI